MTDDANRFTAPAGCSAPRCGYLSSAPSADTCRHGIQMKDGCPWHKTAAQINEMSNGTTKPIRPHSRRWGL